MVRGNRMRAFHLIRSMPLLAIVGIVVSCRTAPWTRQQAVNWYERYAPMVQWVGYQGSDPQFHHYIARVMDDWNFMQIKRAELVVSDERPYPTTSRTALYYYLVDPSTGFQRIDEP